jgi:hypothetical protein
VQSSYRRSSNPRTKRATRILKLSQANRRLAAVFLRRSRRPPRPRTRSARRRISSTRSSIVRHRWISRPILAALAISDGGNRSAAVSPSSTCNRATLRRAFIRWPPERPKPPRS